MEFVVDQADFQRALQNVVRIINPQNTLPVLTAVKVTASAENRVTLTATDLVSEMQTQITATVEDPGEVLLPGAMLAELVQRIPTADVRLRTTADGQVAVLYGRSRTMLQTFGDSNLPPLPEANGPELVASLNPGHLPRMARQTLFAVARDESRPILKGVFLALGEGKALMVSTDGTRLSHTWAPVPELLDAPTTFVLAARAVQEAARLAGTEAVALSFTRNRLQFRTVAGTLTTLPLDGQFPDYKRVIPPEYPVSIRCDTEAFRGALERANLVAHRDRAAAVRLDYHPGSLEISATAQDIGQAVELLDVESTGDPMTVWFNPTLLLDAVRSLEGDQMILEFAGAQLPARFREYEGPAYFHIVLPLRHGV